MPQKFYIGDVGQTGTATGPHIHQYVKDLKTGQYIDPTTLQSPLLGVRVGKQETPLLIKNAQGQIILNPQSGATITSGYGARSAPTKGASTFHQGRDIALPAGTPVKYYGEGTFTPYANQGGFGNLGTIITPDKKYEIGFGHMASLGQPVGATATTSAPATATSQQPSYADSQQRTLDLLQAFMYGARSNRKDLDKPTPQSFADQMKSQLVQSLLGGNQLNQYDQNVYADIDKQLQAAIFG